MVSVLTNFNIINLIAPFHWGEHSATTRQIPISKIKGFIISNLTFQTITTVERRITKARHTISYRDACQATATEESTIVDTCHAVRNCYARKPDAILERPISNTRHAVRYRDVRQATATGECRIADTCHTIWYRDACQTTTMIECKITKARYTVRYYDTRQTTAIGER